jgi:hypothetical protein
MVAKGIGLRQKMDRNMIFDRVNQFVPISLARLSRTHKPVHPGSGRLYPAAAGLALNCGAEPHSEGRPAVSINKRLFRRFFCIFAL